MSWFVLLEVVLVWSLCVMLQVHRAGTQFIASGSLVCSASLQPQLIQSHSAASAFFHPWEVSCLVFLVSGCLCLALCVQPHCDSATALPGTCVHTVLLRGRFCGAGAAVVGWDVPLH